MNISEWSQIHTHILYMEQEGLVTRTFRRLDPDRQQAILSAILDEAGEKGPTALNIKQVAERAGVSVGALYTYFPNRETMLEFAVELCVRFVTDSFDEFRPYLMAMSLRDALSVYIAGGIEWSHMYMDMLRLFARAAYHGDPELAETLVRPIATLLREMIRDMLAQAAERGEVRDDVDLEATERIIHALTIAVGDGQLLPYLNT
jgi:AcrR family transcriptional regulator